MEKSKIINYTIGREQICQPVNDVYELKIKTKRARKIIKALLGKKVIARYEQPLQTFKRTEIKYDRIIPMIRHMLNDIYYRTGNKPRTVIIGYDKMRELEIECCEEMQFNMPLELNGTEGRKIFGLEVIMKPEIDGLLLI